jgi:hypothetical protein
MEHADFFKVNISLLNEEGHLLSMDYKTLIRVHSTDLGKYFVELMRGKLNRIATNYCVNGFENKLIGDNILIGYAMKDGWKSDLVNELIENIDVNDCEKFIGNYGIRLACSIMLNYNDELPNLTTDKAIKQLMFFILYDAIIIDSEVEEIERDEYERIFDGVDEDEDEDEDEEDDDDEEDEDELWKANLMKGDANSALMKEATRLYPDDREACIAYISVKSCGTFNGLVIN